MDYTRQTTVESVEKRTPYNGEPYLRVVLADSTQLNIPIADSVNWFVGAVVDYSITVSDPK